MTRTSPIWVQECVVIYLRIPLLAGLVSGAIFMGIGASLDSAFANSQASVDIVANQIADSIIGGDSSGLQYALSDFFELFLGD